MRSYERKLLEDVLKYKPFSDCYQFHHSKKDQHVAHDRECKPLGRWNNLMVEIEDYIDQIKKGELKNGN
jgi:hypothetical protein